MLLYNSIWGVWSLSQGFQAKNNGIRQVGFVPPPPALPLFTGREGSHAWHRKNGRVTLERPPIRRFHGIIRIGHVRMFEHVKLETLTTHTFGITFVLPKPLVCSCKLSHIWHDKWLKILCCLFQFTFLELSPCCKLLIVNQSPAWAPCQQWKEKPSVLQTW